VETAPCLETTADVDDSKGLRQNLIGPIGKLKFSDVGVDVVEIAFRGVGETNVIGHRSGRVPRAGA
jgi:hypothetical protein